MPRGRNYSFNAQDWMLAAKMATEYHLPCREYFAAMPADVDEMAKKVTQELPRVTFFATNLIFSVELYLKSIHALQKRPVPTNHNLWSLYQRLPRDVKERLEQEYLKLRASTNMKGGLVRLLLSNSELIDEKIVENHLLKKDKMNDPIEILHTCLKRTGDSYKAWRYIFQTVDSDRGFKFIQLDWGPLLLLADTLNLALTNTRDSLGTARDWQDGDHLLD